MSAGSATCCWSGGDGAAAVRRARRPDRAADGGGGGRGCAGLVVRLAGELAAIERDGSSIRCGGGASLAAVVKRATGWGLSGIEFGCAIPGTVGGAVRVNAGAYGGEIRDGLPDALVVGADRERRGGPAELEL